MNLWLGRPKKPRTPHFDTRPAPIKGVVSVEDGVAVVIVDRLEALILAVAVRTDGSRPHQLALGVHVGLPGEDRPLPLLLLPVLGVPGPLLLLLGGLGQRRALGWGHEGRLLVHEVLVEVGGHVDVYKLQTCSERALRPTFIVIFD